MIKKGIILKTKNRKKNAFTRFVYGIHDGEDGVYYFYRDEDNESRVIHSSLKDFSEGNKIYIDTNHRAIFNEEEIVQRAREKYLSEFGNYNEKINNSEHFASYCLTGIRYSIETGVLNREDDTRSSYEKFIDGIFSPLLRAGNKIDAKLGLETEVSKEDKKITILDVIFFPLIKLGELIDYIFKI